MLFQIVDQAGDQRRLRPDHDKADSVRLAKIDHCFVVAGVERGKLRLLRDARIARRAPQRIAMVRLADLPGKGVFAPARTDDENVHARFLCCILL